MNEEQEFDEDGGLVFHLGPEDSALVVRVDGSVELVSREFEKKGETDYLGDFEDLNKTFSLVLALAASLENEQLYAQIFHNLNLVLMKQWDRLPDDKKKEIADIRRERDGAEGMEEKKKRLDSFRERMNKYKDRFLNDEQRRMHEDFENAKENFERMQREGEGPFGPEGPTRRRKRKRNPLAKLQNVSWNPYDETLVTHKGQWRLDTPPDEED